MIIREYRKSEINRLVQLWVDSFDSDTVEFAKMFFNILPNMGACVVGEEDGEIVSMASVIDGQNLRISKSSKMPKVGYVYGVAVDKNHRNRGFGIEITRAAYDLAIKREAVVIATLPASRELYKYYAKVLGFKTVLFRKRIEVEASNIEMITQCISSEYCVMKEEMLAEKTYLRLSDFALEFQQKLCEMSGSGLFASMSGICSAVKEDDVCYIYDLVSKHPEKTAASVANLLKCKKAVCYIPSGNENDIPFIMSDSKMIPKDAIWNIAYE